MGIFTKKFTALIMSFSILTSYGILQSDVFAENGKAYSCNFMQLVKNGAKTMYGTAEDIIELDEYTTAYLTYEGTYVDADGTVYLTGTNNGKGSYTNGSYIEFTAPKDGTVTFSLDYANYFIDETYMGYASESKELKKGQKLRIGERGKDKSKVMSILFTPAPEPTVPPTLAEGYAEETLAGFSCRVKEQNSSAAVIYLASEQRMGEDNVSQLYDAKPVFDKLADSATLIAPQSNEVFTDITGLVSEAKQKYNAQSVTVIGQSQNAAAALSSGADKIITIAGMGNANPDGKVWVFAGYADETTAISDVKTMVNRLQTSGVDTRYTEYPFEGHKINSIVAEESGLADWILNDVSDSKIVDLVLFAGQSNMAGRGEYDEAIKCQAGHGYEYHSVTEPGVLSTVSEPFGKYENNDAVNDNSGSGVDRRSGDMVSAFMESYYNVSGVPIVGVQCSRGGTESSWWANSARMTEAAARYNEAKAYLEANGYTIGKKFMVWCQGCTDADKNRSIDTYKSNTKAIFNTLKSSTGLTDMFMIRIGHRNGDTEIDKMYKAINLAQKELADETDGITAVASFYTDEYFAQMRDAYHYHQPAYNSVGTIAGNNTAYTLYNTGEWTDYLEPDDIPDNVSVSYENNTLTVTANDSRLKSAVVIKAEYNNNIMSDVKTYPIIFTNRKAEIKNIEITEKEKVYVWNSTDGENGMKPLTDVFGK